MDEYYAALGRFISGFSRTEKTLLEVLWVEAGLRHPEAPALLYGFRVANAIETLGRLYESRAKTLHPTLLPALGQLSSINTARNWIVHWGLDVPEGVTPDPKSLLVTNTFLAHNEGSQRKLPVSVADLEAMSTDAGFIQAVLTAQLMGATPEILDALGKQRTWLYKFPQSKAARAKSPKTRGRPPRQQ